LLLTYRLDVSLLKNLLGLAQEAETRIAAKVLNQMLNL
jgi:hypothetical protein